MLERNDEPLVPNCCCCSGGRRREGCGLVRWCSLHPFTAKPFPTKFLYAVLRRARLVERYDTVVPAVRRFRRVRLAAAAGEVRGKAQQICEKRL
jgi:hypothetical protein